MCSHGSTQQTERHEKPRVAVLAYITILLENIWSPKKWKARNSADDLLPPEDLKVPVFFFTSPPSLSLPRSNSCTSSYSVGARRGRGSRGTASCARPPASQKLLPERLRPRRCAAAPAQRCRTPALAAPRQILALPQRFVLTVPQQMYRNAWEAAGGIFLISGMTWLVVKPTQHTPSLRHWTTGLSATIAYSLLLLLSYMSSMQSKIQWQKHSQIFALNYILNFISQYLLYLTCFTISICFLYSLVYLQHWLNYFSLSY